MFSLCKCRQNLRQKFLSCHHRVPLDVPSKNVEEVASMRGEKHIIFHYLKLAENNIARSVLVWFSCKWKIIVLKHSLGRLRENLLPHNASKWPPTRAKENVQTWKRILQKCLMQSCRELWIKFSAFFVNFQSLIFSPLGKNFHVFKKHWNSMLKTQCIT